MNVRKLVNYGTMFAALDKLVAAGRPQMELYCEIGRQVSGRKEKGAAVAVAEHLQVAHPDASGFSPRNLRRMREFYRTYKSAPEVLAEALTIGWTQNVVILEAELSPLERVWYIRAVRRFGWSKLELQRQIEAGAHEKNTLDFEGEVCYTGENTIRTECANDSVNNSAPGYDPCDRKGGGDDGSTQLPYQRSDWPSPTCLVRECPELAEAGLLPPAGCLPLQPGVRPGMSAVRPATDRQNHSPPSSCAGYDAGGRSPHRIYQGYHNGHHGGAEPGHGAATHSGFPLYSAGRSHADTRLHRLRCPAV